MLWGSFVGMGPGVVGLVREDGARCCGARLWGWGPMLWGSFVGMGPDVVGLVRKMGRDRLPRPGRLTGEMGEWLKPPVC